MFDISTTVGGIRTAFYYIFGVSAFFIVAITATMIFFVFRFSRRRNPVATDIEGATWLEVTWTVIPTLLALGMFYYGWMGFLVTRRTPQGALKIGVQARMYSWVFVYPNGKRGAELLLPAGQPVEAELTAGDVVHSFYIPAFKIKEDLVPGQTNRISFTPLRTGTYDIFCAEYCGVGHSAMLSRLIVMRPKEFEAWYHSRDAQKPIELTQAIAGTAKQFARGKAVYETQCVSCHGAAGRGDQFAGARDFTALSAWKNGAKMTEIFRTVTQGLGRDMPSFAHLAAEDRLAAAQYVRHFATGAPQDSPEETALLDEQYNLSKGSDAPPEIPVEQAMRLIAAEAAETTRTGGAAPQRALDDAGFAQLQASNPLGARLYAAHCAECHGGRGEGGRAVATLDKAWDARLMSLSLIAAGSAWRAGEAADFRRRIQESSIATGGIKPAFATLTQGEWDALRRFAFALQPGAETGRATVD